MPPPTATLTSRKLPIAVLLIVTGIVAWPGALDVSPAIAVVLFDEDDEPPQAASILPASTSPANPNTRHQAARPRRRRRDDDRPDRTIQPTIGTHCAIYIRRTREGTFSSSPSRSHCPRPLAPITRALAPLSTQGRQRRRSRPPTDTTGPMGRNVRTAHDDVSRPMGRRTQRLPRRIPTFADVDRRARRHLRPVLDAAG